MSQDGGHESSTGTAKENLWPVHWSGHLRCSPSASRRLQGGAEAATEGGSGVLWVPPCPGDWVPHVGPPVGPTTADDSGTCGSLGAWGSPRGFVTCPEDKLPPGQLPQETSGKAEAGRVVASQESGSRLEAAWRGFEGLPCQSPYPRGVLLLLEQGCRLTQGFSSHFPAGQTETWSPKVLAAWNQAETAAWVCPSLVNRAGGGGCAACGSAPGHGEEETLWLRAGSGGQHEVCCESPPTGVATHEG